MLLTWASLNGHLSLICLRLRDRRLVFSDLGTNALSLWTGKDCYRFVLQSLIRPVYWLHLLHTRATGWIHAIPSDNCGLLLDDETLRIAVGVRLGSALCLPYTCICGASIDEKCLHSFACKKNSGRYIRHSILNDVIYFLWPWLIDLALAIKSKNTCTEGTSWLECAMRAARWRWFFSEATWWCINHAMEKRQKCFMGRNSGRYFCQFIHRFNLSGSWNCCRNCRGEEEDKIRGTRSKIFVCSSRVQKLPKWPVCGAQRLVTFWTNWVAESVRWPEINVRRLTCFNDSLSLYRRATLHVSIIFHQPPLNVTVVTIRPNWFYHIVQCYNAPRNEVLGAII